MRLVLDTNIYVSALMSPLGPPGRLVRLVRRAPAYRPVTSTAQLAELRRVLEYVHLKRRISPEQSAAFLDGLQVIADVQQTLPEGVWSPDTGDNAIIATAIAGQADFIVSGDKRHLVSLKETAGIAIITARQALERMGEENQADG